MKSDVTVITIGWNTLTNTLALVLCIRLLRMFENIPKWQTELVCLVLLLILKKGTSQIALVKKKNAKSILWDYFGLKAEEDGKVQKENKSHPVC